MTYHPFHTFGEDRPGRWLITCDHATNFVPAEVADGDLGLTPADMGRHIAFDPGAAGVSLALAELLDSPCVCSNFSRLVIDPNRGEDDPTLLMKLYDGSIIPANRHAGQAEKERRLNLCYRPYHQEVARLAARQDDTIYIAIHSFTPQLRGRDPRPWHIGVLYADDERFTAPLIERLHRETDLVVGANEPYGGHLEGDSVDRHAIRHRRVNALIEIRNDLIVTDGQQYDWAARLAPILEEVRAKADL